ncbi:hypothetical protein D5R55_01850 [Burkholderia cenocepacia]|uniref:Uncharacterized protein n=1 Tax=Burkholderia cenocepacia TaxID=95486 RepID=A0A3S9N2P3_9BURK|nr:hypothetical protein D5R55_01850 [Burkholderia cenocepacia]
MVSARVPPGRPLLPVSSFWVRALRVTEGMMAAQSSVFCRAPAPTSRAFAGGTACASTFVARDRAEGAR